MVFLECALQHTPHVVNTRHAPQPLVLSNRWMCGRAVWQEIGLLPEKIIHSLGENVNNDSASGHT